MHKNYTAQLRKKALATAITTTLGVAATSIPGTAISDIYFWGSLAGVSDATDCATNPDAATILFTIIDGAGSALANTSIPAKGNNQYQTPTCGTLSYNTDTESGTLGIAEFEFFAGSSPAVAGGITFNKLSNAEGFGNDNLWLANMLFDWNGSNGIPVSTVWDAQALMSEMDGTPTSFTLNADGSIASANDINATGGVPASDGIYVGAAVPGTITGPGGFPGYLGLGPTPIATTAYDTTPNCTAGVDCQSNPNSGTTPIVVDSSASADFTQNLGGGTTAGSFGSGSSPMLIGPFATNNANFDFTNIKLVSFVDATPPTLSLNGSQGAVINATAGDTYVEDGASCTDAAPLNTNLNASVVIGGDTIPVPLDTSGEPYTVTYDCQDPSTNDAVQITRTINVAAAGSQDPVIDLTAPGPVTHECAVAYTDPGATCTDPQDGNIPVGAMPPQDFSLSTAMLDIGDVTMNPQTVTWSCTDNDGNTTTLDRDVNIEDTTAPVITLNGSDPDNLVSTTPQNGGPAVYPDPGATLAEACDTTLTNGDINVAGTVNMSVPDTGAAIVPTILTYSATDTTGMPGNTGSTTRTVNITRSQPVITTVIGGGVVLNVGDPYTEQGVTAIDEQQLPGGGSENITGGTSPNGLTLTIGGDMVDTNTPGTYNVTYTITDPDGNISSMMSRSVSVGGAFATGSNFTMLDSNGNSIGGTNDVVFEWDGTTFNTDETDTNFGVMNIYSQKPQKFNNFVWTAHRTRVFNGPAMLQFDTSCTKAELDAGLGSTTMPCAGNGPFIQLNIPAGHIGAHILFDWNTSSDIDVVNVWEPNGMWNFHPGSGFPNELHKGAAGLPPADDTIWDLVSIDSDGDFVNGSPMIDGPFSGSNANFSAGPQTTGTAPGPTVMTARDTKLGNSLLVSMGPLGLLAGLLSLFGLRRFTKR